MRPFYRYVLALAAVLMLAGATAALSTDYNVTYLNVPGAYGTWPNRINDAGQVVGAYSDGSGIHGFIYSGGNFTTLNAPGSMRNNAADINMAGQVVGTYFAGGTINGFIYNAGTETYTLLDSWPDTRLYGINNAGQIVGGGASFAAGFIYNNGYFTRMPDFPGSVVDTTLCFDINNAASSLFGVGKLEIKLPSDEVDHGDEIFSGTVSPGLGLGRLD